MVEECFDVAFLKLLDGHQHLGGVQQYVGTVDISLDHDVALEGLAQIDGHRDTCLHDVRRIYDGLLRVRGVEHGEGEIVSPDAKGYFPFVHHLSIHHTGHADCQQSRSNDSQYDIDQSVIALHIGCKDTIFFLMFNV